jgi:cell division cycle protein 37
MIAGDKRAETVFLDDVEKTYSHLASRVAATASPGEQIQLVPENPGQTISFNVPDGPPPAELVLEGPGTEGLDVEEVRRALQLRWDVFQRFSPEMRKALRSGSLDHVNQVLGTMPVDEAEQLVSQLDMVGILNFAEGGVRDETGKAKATQEDDEEEVDQEGTDAEKR